MDRKVVYQEIFWVPNTRLVPHPWPPAADQSLISKSPVDMRVWTLFAKSHPKMKPDTSVEPIHNVNAFLEDHIHDWYLTKNDELRYYSRVCGHNVWILIQYLEPQPQKRGARK